MASLKIVKTYTFIIYYVYIDGYDFELYTDPLTKKIHHILIMDGKYPNHWWDNRITEEWKKHING